MKRDCFICTTPYQIIAACTIAYSTYNENLLPDMIVVPQFQNADLCAERIEHSQIFHQVILSDFETINRYKSRTNRIGIGIGIIEQYLSIEKSVPQYLGDRDYSRIYISSQAIVGRLISLYFLKRGAEIIFFDDGEGSYDDNKLYEAQGIDRAIRNVLFGKESIRLGNSRQVYCTDLYKMTFGHNDYVTAIPNWGENKEILGKLNTIFNYSEEARINQDYILLDTIPSESFDEKGASKYNELFAICEEELGKKLMIKKHPRDNRKGNDSCAVYRYPTIPFELICANSDINEKVLISAGSSALLMPKILFNSEPTVILLHHITGNRLGDTEKRERMILYIRELYKDKERFMIPESTGEFRGLLAAIEKERKDNNDVLLQEMCNA